MDTEIVPFDWWRIFVGEPPVGFIFEIVLRVVVIYVYALIMVQFMGKRGRKQMNPLEYLIIIALGSATGDVMFYPQVPLSHAAVVIGLIILLGFLTAKLESVSERARRLFESGPTCLVRDGLLLEANLRSERLSRAELYSQLREAGVEQLGQVRAAFLELSGNISVFKYPDDQSRAGESIMPAD